MSEPEITININYCGGLETIFHGCEQLEKIKVRCWTHELTDLIFEIVAEHSPKDFQELEIHATITTRSFGTLFC